MFISLFNALNPLGLDIWNRPYLKGRKSQFRFLQCRWMKSVTHGAATPDLRLPSLA